MSILNQNHKLTIDESAQRAVNVKTGIQRICTQLIRNWERSFDQLWDSPDPAAVLAAMGTDAAEAFELSSQLVTLMGQILPGRMDDEWARIQAKIAAKRQPTTTHSDGTVTLD